MIRPRDFALDTFEAALALLTGAYEGAGLGREEIRGALQRRLRAYGGPLQARPFDPERPADGGEVFVEVPAEGGAGVPPR